MWFIPLLFVSLSWGFTPTQVCEEPQDNFVQNLLDKVKPAPVFKRKGYITPEEYRNLSSRQIGELIVKHLHQECDEVRGATEGTEMGEDSDIMMFVPNGVLDSAAKYGFQNQHVTRTTKGCDCRENRYNAEVNFPGKMLGYGPKGKDVLPKYSALNVRKEANFNSGWVGGAEGYGDVILVFKPAVKKRTTWTTDDSLGLGAFRGSKATNTLDFKDKKDKPIKCGTYCEAQIWGELDMSDVAYAMVKPGATVPPALATNGIAVYERSDDKSSVGHKKGKLLSAAAPAKLKPVTRHPAAAGWDKENTENDVVKNVVTHKKIQQMDYPSLINAYEKSIDMEEKREIIGQLALNNIPAIKDYFLKSYLSCSDNLARSQMLLGLSEHGSDPKVRELFKDVISENKRVLIGDSEFRMAMAIIADTPGFLQDAELQKLARAEGKRLDEKLYKRLFEDGALCPEYNPTESDYIGWGSGF